MSSDLTHTAPSTATFCAAPGSRAAGLASALAWLWRLGFVDDETGGGASKAIAFGTLEELPRLEELVQTGELAAAVVTVSGDVPAEAGAPAGRTVKGIAEIGGSRAEDEFTVLETGTEATVASALGIHAAARGYVLFLGFDPVEGWGRLSSFWAYEEIARFAEQRAGARLRKLPPIGCLRLDDIPGTALHQLQERAKDDRRQQRKIRRLASSLQRAGAVLNVAVVAQAMEDGERVPLERVWPESVRRLGDGVRSGVYEPVLHGLIHLDLEALERGEVDHREFSSLDAEGAGDHIDRALEWQSRHLARPTNFVAPGWAYGVAGDEQGAARGLVRWHRAVPGPLLADGRLHESLIGELYGLHRLDYSPLQRLAAVGIPPMIAMHGALLDTRLPNLKRSRDLLSLSRLMLRRDVTRLMGLDGIRWVGATELISELEAHAAS